MTPLSGSVSPGSQGLALALAGCAVGDAQRIVGLGSVGEIEPGVPVLRQAAVPEVVDANQPGQPRDAAEMVPVPVRRDQMIEMVAARQVLQDMDDPLRVAIVQARPARVDQDRLALGRHQQRRRAAHHVDEVDLQPAAARPADCAGRHAAPTQQEPRQSDTTHGFVSIMAVTLLGRQHSLVRCVATKRPSDSLVQPGLGSDTF